MAPKLLTLALLLLERGACVRFGGRAEPSRGNVVTGGYYWPSGRGQVGHYSASANQAPADLPASLAWTWSDPRGRYRNSPVGVNLDDRQNIYLTSLDGIRQFTPEGKVLWTYAPQRAKGEEMPDTASLYDGAVYCSTTHGRIFALSMETGKTGDQLVTGLNASDGSVMWNFAPTAPLWNFMGSFAGDGTFVFQDYEGRAYRCRVKDGSLMWKNGGLVGTWTDGSALLGPNGIVYTVNTRHMDGVGPSAPGDVCAYRLKDGELLWNTTVPRPPNNMPAIGKLAGRKGLSIVQPIGQQVMKGAPTDVYALDAETGEVQWVFNGPAQHGLLQKGDDNLMAAMQRQMSGVRPITLPNPWSAPSVDSQGTVFIGSEEGLLYSLRDENGDGKVAGATEVSKYDAKACFGGSSSPAIGRNMMAVASIDALYVFKG